MYRTTAAYVSGGICGRMWMPECIGGRPHQFNVAARRDRFADHTATFRDILLHELMECGGDFQNARFTADTVIRIERRRVDGPGKYSVHVWEREVAKLRDCADLVDDEAYTGDFCGDCE